METDPCETALQDYEKALRDYIGFYRTVLAVHLKFTVEHITEFERLDAIQRAAKAKWLACVSKNYLGK